MPESLAEKTCTPCQGGVPPLSEPQVREFLSQAADWEAVENHTKIQGQFKFKNFRTSLVFVRQVGELAEAEFHHPLFINFGWGFATIVLQTKKIKGLHENDFIMAAKINEIAESVVADAGVLTLAGLSCRRRKSAATSFKRDRFRTSRRRPTQPVRTPRHSR